MIIFKQSKWVLFKDILSSFAGAFVIGIIANIFIDDMRYVVLIACIFLLLLLYMAIFSDNISFEFANGKMSYFKKNKLKETFILKECSFRYQSKSGRNTADSIMLYVTKNDSDQETFIDCTPLGHSQFYKMFDLIKKETDLGPEVLVATNKGDTK